MQRERPNADPDPAEERGNEKRRGALEVLVEARERLVSQLCDEILSSRDVILDDSSPEGLFGFEFQEIEDRYSARLHALNSILENLEYRKPRIAHRVEAFRTTSDRIGQDLNDVVDRYDQWDIVDIDVTPVEEGELLVVVGFTADEYPE